MLLVDNKALLISDYYYYLYCCKKNKQKTEMSSDFIMACHHNYYPQRHFQPPILNFVAKGLQYLYLIAMGSYFNYINAFEMISAANGFCSEYFLLIWSYVLLYKYISIFISIFFVIYENKQFIWNFSAVGFWLN